MEAIFQLLYFISYPLNWILYDLKYVFAIFLPIDYAGFLAYYIVFITLYAYAYSKLIDSLSIKTILMENVGLHIVTLIIVSLCGFMTEFTPSYGEDGNVILFTNMGIFCIGLFAIKSFAYDIGVVERGVDGAMKNDKFK